MCSSFEQEDRYGLSALGRRDPQSGRGSYMDDGLVGVIYESTKIPRQVTVTLVFTPISK